MEMNQNQGSMHIVEETNNEFGNSDDENSNVHS